MIVRSFACLALLFAGSVNALCQRAEAHTRLRIGLIVTATSGIGASTSVARGVTLGAAEAKQTAALFGDDVQLFEATGSGSQAVAAANQLLSGRQVQVLIATSSADADALSRFAESRHVVFLNVVSRSQSLREACRRYTFHVEASDRMYATADRLGRTPRLSVVNGAPSSGSLPSDSVVLWGSSLERFGASQINQRFRDKYHLEMDGGAWGGWMAVKVASEAALRARSSEPAKLTAYLESVSTQFDGHKGWPLSFRRADHQLRQPLYVVVSGSPGRGKARLRDIPELHASAQRASSEPGAARSTDLLLETLIASPDGRKCSQNVR
jgi:ABC-type branched-subunit amino acid transport system substrate-binding protein